MLAEKENEIRRFGRREGKSTRPAAVKAVVYARVSTPEQHREGYSIAAQIRLLQDYAAENGIDIVESFVDVETARKSGRLAFGQMLKFSHAPAYSQVARRENRSSVPQSEGLGDHR